MMQTSATTPPFSVGPMKTATLPPTFVCPAAGGIYPPRSATLQHSKSPMSMPVSPTITSARTPPARPAPVRLDLELSQTPQHLADVIREHKLPRVVKCDPATATTTNLPLDITQPLLIYTKRSARKVAARGAVFHGHRGRYVETGDDILIPEDYIGWFGVLGSPASLKIEATVPHYPNVSRLAISGCKRFLVGGDAFVKGYASVKANGTWTPHKIFPGDILRKGGIFEERQELVKKGAKKHKSKEGKKSAAKQEKNNNKAYKKGDLISVTNKYLRCYDRQDREIHINLMEEGLFYVLSQDGTVPRIPVLEMHDILQKYKFPLLVKLLYGSVPSTPCAFTDTLLLTEAAVSQTVLASTLDNQRNINLEIPLDNDMLFYVAEETEALVRSRAYNQALADCKSKAGLYLRAMKVLFGTTSGRSHSISSGSTDVGSVSSMSETPASPSPSESEAPDADWDSIPHISLRHKTASCRSRISVISRLITVNLEDQTMFVPNMGTSPGTPPVARANDTSWMETGDKKPHNLDPVEDFKPPPLPQIIRGNNMIKSSISPVGNKRRHAFQDSKPGRSNYEEPTPVFLPSDEEDDEDPYDTMWDSSSIATSLDPYANIPELDDTDQATDEGSASTEHYVSGDIGGDREGNIPSVYDTLDGNVNSADVSAVSSPDITSTTSTTAPRPVTLSTSSSKGEQFDMSGSFNSSNTGASLTSPSSPISTGRLGQDDENPLLTSPTGDPRSAYRPHLTAISSSAHVYALVENTQYENDHLEQVVSSDNATRQTDATSYVNRDSIMRASTDSEYLNSRESTGAPYLVPQELFGGTGLSIQDSSEYSNYKDSQELAYRNSYAVADPVWAATPSPGGGATLYELNNPWRSDRPSMHMRNADSTSMYANDGSVVGDTYENIRDSVVSNQPSISMRSEGGSQGYGNLRNSDVNSTYAKVSDPGPTSPTSLMSELQLAFRGKAAANKNLSSSITDSTEPTASHSSDVSSAISPPPLPKNHPPKAVNIKSTLEMLSRGVRAQPEPMDLLIAELPQLRLKSSTELAVRALQAADLAILAQKDEGDLDETLHAMLPTVGQIERRKITICVRKLGIKLENN